MTIAVRPCVPRVAAKPSAEGRSGYGPRRTTNGACCVTVAFSGEPIARTACCASATLPKGPAVIVARGSAFAVTTNELPRPSVAWMASSFGSRAARSRTRCHPAVTSVSTRANAAGSPPSPYDWLSFPRSVRPSASGTSLSRIGPVRSSVALNTAELNVLICFAASIATSPYRAGATVRVFAPESAPARP